MLIDIANLWNEILIISIIIYMIALVLVGFTFIATHTNHLIIGAIVALTAGIFGNISKIAFRVGTFLMFLRLVLYFI